MLKLNKFEYGIAPFGSMSGMGIFHIDFGVDEKVYNNEDEMAANANDIVEQLMNLIPSVCKEERWAEFLMGERYLVVTGDDIMAGDEKKVTNAVFNAISHVSLEMQKTIAVHKMIPPRMCFMGQPKHFTGKDQWYENFDLVYCMLPVKDENGKPYTAGNTPISDMALAEMSNASMAQFMSKVSSPEEAKLADELYFTRKDCPIDYRRSGIIIDNDNLSEEVIDFCNDSGIRIFNTIPKNALKL